MSDGYQRIRQTIREHGSVFGVDDGSTKADRIRWSLVIKLPEEGYLQKKPTMIPILVQSITHAITSKAPNPTATRNPFKTAVKPGKTVVAIRNEKTGEIKKVAPEANMIVVNGQPADWIPVFDVHGNICPVCEETYIHRSKCTNKQLSLEGSKSPNSLKKA